MEEKLILAKRVTLFMQVTKIFKCLEKLPQDNEIIKLISLGGFSSIAFILRVAEEEVIEELYASTLRIGKKEIIALDSIYKKGKLKQASFMIGSVMYQDTKTNQYNYFQIVKNICAKNDWDFYVANNHSKIILIKTTKNYYVLETSSNLNENPKIEQYSFTNDEALYSFYKDFFILVKKGVA